MKRAVKAAMPAIIVICILMAAMQLAVNVRADSRQYEITGSGSIGGSGQQTRETEEETKSEETGESGIEKESNETAKEKQINKKSPRTGDETDLIFYLSVLLFAMISIFYMVKKEHKR